MRSIKESLLYAVRDPSIAAVMRPALGSVACRCFFRRQTVNCETKRRRAASSDRRPSPRFETLLCCFAAGQTVSVGLLLELVHVQRPLIIFASSCQLVSQSPRCQTLFGRKLAARTQTCSRHFACKKTYCYRDFCVFLSHCDANPVFVSR